LEPTSEELENQPYVQSWLETLDVSNEYDEADFESAVVTADFESEGSMQSCLATSLAKGMCAVSSKEIWSCLKNTTREAAVREAELRKQAVGDEGVEKAAESLRFTVEEFVACAYLMVHIECVITYDDLERLFSSFVLLRQAIARYFTDDVIVAHIKRWDFLFKDPTTTLINIRLLYGGVIPAREFYRDLMAVPRYEIPSCLVKHFKRGNASLKV